ncbi:MAG: hypothetical protein AB1700_00635 [Bacillota bacterium]
MNWTEIITAIVAVYGAVLATYTLVVQLRENRFRVNVKISMGFLVSPLGGTSDTMLFLSASNAGQKVVTLSSQGFLLPNKNQLVIPYPQSNVTFPYELLPGKSCQTWIEAREIARALKLEGIYGEVKLVGFYRDQVDKTYRSKPYKFDVDGWGKRT